MRVLSHQVSCARLHTGVQQAHPPIPQHSPSPVRRRRILLLRQRLHRRPDPRRRRHSHGSHHPLQLLLRPPHDPRQRPSLGPPPQHQRLLPLLHNFFHRARPRRWDPQEQTLLPVISRLDIPIPKGIRVSPDQKTLYVTESLGTHAGSAAQGNQAYPPTAGPYIYAYDLNDAAMPVNRRVFGLVRTGYADGIHVDDAGRVWTAEGEGAVVRSAPGKVLGVFNAAAFGIDAKAGVHIANFALAGETLFVAAFDRLYAVEMAAVVPTGQS